MSQAATALEFRIFDLVYGGFIGFALFKLVFEVLSSLFDNLLILSVLERAFCDQFFCIGLRDRFHRSNNFIHLGLGESRFVHLVVSVFTEPYHVKKDILAKGLPIPHSQFANLCY